MQANRTDLFFVIMVAAYFIVSFFPDLRLWGINSWAYFPIWARSFILIVGLSGLFLARFLSNYSVEEQASRDKRRYIFITTAISIVLIALFYLLRAQTHFLGDGYEAIALLSQSSGFLKKTNYGTVLVTNFIYDMFDDSSDSNALLTYQVVSYFSGAIFVLVSAVLAWCQWSDLRTRILGFLVIITSGCMLLFFGYVENYSLFVLLVLIYAMVGLLAVDNRISKYWIFPAFVFVLFFHVFGSVLVLPTIYVLFRRTTIGDKIKTLQSATKVLIAVLLGLAGLVILAYAFKNYMFLRFAIVPLFDNRFTIDGYSLFSLAHLLDFVNLLVLLVPGLPLLFLLKRRQCKRWVRTSAGIFLLLLTGSSILIAFIFEPKLGMPRDWDLFSFAAVPLSLIVFSLFLSDKKSNLLGVKLASYAIVLGVISLTARVGIGAVPEHGLQQFRNNMKLDRARGRNAGLLLVNYFKAQGDSLKSEEELELWVNTYPERREFFIARNFADRGLLPEAISRYEAIVLKHPDYFDVWSNLGAAYLKAKLYDTASVCLEIAVGLNPYNGEVRANLGMCDVYLGRLDQAEKHLLQAEKAIPSSWTVVYNLATVYQSMHNKGKYIEYLEKTIRIPDGPVGAYLRLAGVYVASGEVDKARNALSTAISKDADTSVVNFLVKKYPQLKPVTR